MRNGLDTRYYNVQNGREIFLHDRGNREVYADHAPLKKTGQALSVVQQWSGAVTKIQTVEYHRVLDQGTWKALWERHLGQGVVVPQVDFTAHMVIAIFPGKKINSSGVKAVDARLEEGAVYFDYDYEIYKPKGRVDMMLAFGFFVIPQAKQKIILRENMQNGVGDLLPAWKVVKEFEALK
ncbi:MAG: hypothetical protein A2787_09465 [Omnitrophica WOR_2 bacterium RIFCSPHIGHO2_01_FULL_48_9]|nr:MAG: hypothetical protein A2787_09465 [Omnitrophica WOR_2 bacterium RIFCSPHIGHO2_01_FULL_48_9]